jgi:hypothetical protein
VGGRYLFGRMHRLWTQSVRSRRPNGLQTGDRCLPCVCARPRFSNTDWWSERTYILPLAWNNLLMFRILYFFVVRFFTEAVL